MITPTPPRAELTTGLYGRLVHGDIGALPASVVRLCFAEASTAAHGWFRVQRRSGLIVRLIGRFLGLPGTQEAMPVSLFIVRSDGEEVWLRAFGTQLLVSTQTAGGGGVLIEQFGPFALSFGLRIDGAVLRFDQRATHVVVGRCRVRLPTALAPRVHAAVSDDAGAIQVNVSFAAPLVGPVLRYGGDLHELSRS